MNVYIEIFAKPAVGAIVEKVECGNCYIIIQERNKESGGIEDGMIELPAGKIREYENIFAALRCEIWEETGLNVTYINGEDDTLLDETSGYETISFHLFCVTQNLSGGYSIVLQTFLCQAEGGLLLETNETTNIRWEQIEVVKTMLAENPQRFYPMHINALKKYLSIHLTNSYNLMKWKVF